MDRKEIGKLVQENEKLADYFSRNLQTPDEYPDRAWDEQRERLHRKSAYYLKILLSMTP